MFFYLLIAFGCCVTWSKCPVRTSNSPAEKNIFFYIKEEIPVYFLDPFRDAPYPDTGEAECALFDFPLIRSVPNPYLLDIYVKSFRHINSSYILFLFPSSPGLSSESLETLAVEFFDDLPEHDIVLVTHRGVGRSNRIGCTPSGGETEGSPGGFEIIPSEINDCVKNMKAKYGENVKGFSTTSAAEDVIDIIKILQEESSVPKKIDLLGIGYGSYLANRVVQVGQEKNMTFRSVILDSVFSQSGEGDYNYSGTRFTWDVLNNQFQKIGVKILEKCIQDRDSCGKRMEKDKRFNLTDLGPAEFTKKIFENVFMEESTQGLCRKLRDIFSDEIYMKEFLGAMAVNTYYRELIPAFLYRVIRCSELEDYGAFEHILDYIREESNKKLTRVPLSSVMEGLHISYNEFYTYPNPEYPVDELKARQNRSSFVLLQEEFGKFLKSWPKYISEDIYFRKTTEIQGDTKYIILAGELDPITPVEYAETQYSNMGKGKNIIYREIPHSSHGVIFNSPMNTGRLTCGYEIARTFFRYNLSADFSCVDELRKIRFDGNKDVSSLVFGCDEPFDCTFIFRTKELTISLEVFIVVELATVLVLLSVLAVVMYCCCIKMARNAKFSLIGGEDARGKGYEPIDAVEEYDAEELRDSYNNEENGGKGESGEGEEDTDEERLLLGLLT